MKKIKFLLTLILAVCMLKPAKAQTSTQGTDFWFSYLMDANAEYGVQQIAMLLYITSQVHTSGEVSSLSSTTTIPFTVVPDKVTIVDLAATFKEVPFKGEEIIHNIGIHVTSDDPISLVTSAGSDYTMDATLVLPTEALGTIYRTINYCSFPGARDYPSQVLLIATQDDTEIEITPASDTYKGKVAGQPFTITLDQGQVYLVGGISDMSNTLVEGKDPCKPFAVITGETCTNVPAGACCCDMIFDQLLPIKTWGRKYATVPFRSREKGDVFRIIAAEDKTKFKINGGPPKFLNASSYFEFISEDPTIIESDKPISVAQFSTSQQYDGKDGDPDIVVLQALQQTLNRIVFATIYQPNLGVPTVTYIHRHYMNVIMKTVDVPTFRIDGLQNPPSVDYVFKPFPGDSSLSYAQLYILPDNASTPHIIEAGGQGFIAYGYDYSPYQSFAYSEGFNYKNLANIFTVTDPACKGAPITFTPFILSDQTFDGYKWDFGDGTISNVVNPSHTYNNPGTYTVKLYLIDNTQTCGNILDSISQTVEVKDGIGADAGSDKLICQGDGIQIGAPPVPGLTYSWSPADGLSDPSIANPIANPQWSTAYTLTISNNTSICNASDEVLVTVNPLPWAVYTYAKDGLIVQFNGIDNHGITSWEWDFGDRSVPSTEQNPVHTFVQTDRFIVTLIVTNQCGKDTVIFEVNVDGSSGNGGGNTGIEQSASEDLLVYPNPFTGSLNIDFTLPAPSKVSIEIFDVLGRSVYTSGPEELLQPGKQHIELNTLLPASGGVFYLCIKKDNTSYLKRVVKLQEN